MNYLPASLSGWLDRFPRGTASFLGVVAILSVIYWKPLFELVTLTFREELYSHILLVPLISLYLIWRKRESLPDSTGASPLLAAIPVVIGTAAIVAYWLMGNGEGEAWQNDRLVLRIFSYYCFIVGVALVFFGHRVVSAVAFPVAFLVFMVPFPAFVVRAVETFFQHTSAEAAYLFIKASGTPVLRDGLVFRLSGIVMGVAEECSGIRSSLVLFITSLLAGHLLLRSAPKRMLLALSVIFLGIVRNGFRIFTIGMLCAHVDPAWINSPLHHRGGPIFFVLSLIPFFALLILLIKWERRQMKLALAVPAGGMKAGKGSPSPSL